MEVSRRDATEEWVLPESARPPRLSELEARIDQALATARSSEAAVMAIGEAALDAAEQARRSADMAERAQSLVAERLGSEPEPEPVTPGLAVPPAPAAFEEHAAPTSGSSSNGPGTQPGAGGEDPMSAFTARADSIAARLQRLQRVPLTPVR